MNLKHYYYRTYFSDLELEQPEADDARKEIERKNEPRLKAHNQHLTGRLPRLMTATASAAPGYALPPGNVEPLLLYVQNPGLIPGIGYPHEVAYAGEFKLGMHFDHTAGLPALPGSSVKGALRALWPQYAYPEANPGAYQPDRNGEKAALQAQKGRFVYKLLRQAGVSLPDRPEADVQAFVHRLELAVFEGWQWPSAAGQVPKWLPLGKRAVFFDAFPVSAARTTEGDRLLGRDALTPHGDDPLRNPIPLPFVKVMPGVGFAFSFRLFEIVLDGVAVSPQALRVLFAVLLEKSGAGAKTSVGYGRFGPPPGAGDEQRGAQERRGGEQRRPPESVRPVAPPARPAQALEYKRTLGGKTVVVKVLAVEGDVVQFELENVAGAEGPRTLKHPSAGLLRPGSRYAWRVSEANPEKNILTIKIESFKPLD